MPLMIQIMIVSKRSVMSVEGEAVFQTKKENFVLIATSHAIVKNVFNITKVTQRGQNQNVVKEKNV